MPIRSDNIEKRLNSRISCSHQLPDALRPDARNMHMSFQWRNDLLMGRDIPVPLVICMLLLMLFTSCSLFETREPEDPGTTTVPVFIQPDRPQDVIQNLQNTVRALNLDNYRRCLTESFEYEPSSVAQSSNPDLWLGWGFADEEVYFNNMRAEAEGLSGHDLQLDNRRFVQISQDMEQFDADYRITVQHNRQGLPVSAEGRMRLIITRDESGIWAIEAWSDAAEGSDFTWSDFRAAFL